jgi:arylsulfatase A-like enzyme
MLFEHGCIGKRLFYEGSCHVPFIISGPPALEYRAKVDTHQIASLEDVMPTLLDMCGIDIPDTVDGISLISEKKHTYIFGEITEGTKATRMIVDGRYKLIYYPCGNMVQLFDIEQDKLELHDLSGCADLLEIKEKLVKDLIENLHDGDEQWVKDGKLIGFDAPMKNEPVDFGLHNQRGSHWPPPGQYSNFGNSQK